METNKRLTELKSPFQSFIPQLQEYLMKEKHSIYVYNIIKIGVLTGKKKKNQEQAPDLA